MSAMFSRLHVMPTSALGALVGLAMAAAWSPPAEAADGGRLATYPLVYRATWDLLPGPRLRYIVFFRTRGSFIGRDSVGTTIPGRIDLEDASDNHDGFFGVINSRPHCYGWILAATPRLGRKRVGDKVRLRFRLRRSPTQRRTVTLRGIPRRLTNRGPRHPWYHNGNVGRSLRMIGCGPPGQAAAAIAG
jgi:hypothetical protein